MPARIVKNAAGLIRELRAESQANGVTKHRDPGTGTGLTHPKFATRDSQFAIQNYFNLSIARARLMRASWELGFRASAAW